MILLILSLLTQCTTITLEDNYTLPEASIHIRKMPSLSIWGASDTPTFIYIDISSSDNDTLWIEDYEYIGFRNNGEVIEVIEIEKLGE